MLIYFLSGKIECVQAAFLDLQRVDIPPQAGLIDAGPSGCLSGQLQMVQGQLGMPSQVCGHSATLDMQPCTAWHAAE